MEKKNDDNENSCGMTLGIIIFMFSPIIIAGVYQWIMGLKGIAVNEANSLIFTFSWLSIFTIPIGCLILIIRRTTNK